MQEILFRGFHCLCGAVFESPLKIEETANHGEGMKEHGFCALCPSCGCEEPYFEEIEEGDEDGCQIDTGCTTACH